MTFFVCSQFDTAAHFYQLASKLSGQGHQVNILSCGNASRMLPSFGNPQIYHDIGRQDISEGLDQLEEQERKALIEEITQDIHVAVSDLAQTIILEVGTELSLFVASLAATRWHRKRLVFYCGEETRLEGLKSQLSIVSPEVVLLANREIECYKKLDKHFIPYLAHSDVYLLGFRFSYARDQIHTNILKGQTTRKELFEQRKIKDDGQIVISILGSCEPDQDKRSRTLLLLIKSLEQFVKKQEKPVIVFHRLSPVDPELERLSLDLFALDNGQVKIYHEERLPYECLAISKFVCSLKTTYAIECIWAGLNVVGFGSLRDRKLEPYFCDSRVGRFADSVFAFQKLLACGCWKVNQKELHKILGYREDWGDRLNVILSGIIPVLSSAPQPLEFN